MVGQFLYFTETQNVYKNSVELNTNGLWTEKHLVSHLFKSLIYQKKKQLGLTLEEI